MEEVFYTLIKEGKISKDKLLRIIGEDYIQYMEDNHILKPIDDYYVVDDVEELLYLGKYYIDNKQFSIGNKIFDCCYNTDPKNLLVNLQLYYKSIFTKKVQDIYKYFSFVYNSLVESDRIEDANFYLLLTGYLYGVDEKYPNLVDKFNNMSEKDLILDYKKDNYDENENLLRKYMLDKKFYAANKYINYVFDGRELILEETIERELLIKVMAHNREVNGKIEEYVDRELYEELSKYLKKEHNKKSLLTTNEYIYLLVDKYINMLKTKKLPEITRLNTSTTFEAIEANDFNRALKLLKEYNNEKGIEKKSALYKLLEKTNELVRKISQNENIEIKVNEDEPISFQDKKLIDDKVKLLRNGRVIVLLEPMDKKRRNSIYTYLKEFNDVVSFGVGDDTERRIVLRYKPKVEEFVDVHELSDRAHYYVFKEKNYKEAFKCYQLLLRIGTPRVKTYGDCGLALLKLHRKEEALDCFKTANYLAKDLKLNIDYSEIIEGLVSSPNVEDKKTKVEVKEEEFTTVKEDNNFINDLIGLIDAEEITVEEACRKLNLDEVQINYVKLLIARDYYYLNEQKKGDQLLKEVVKSKNKSPEIKKLINELNASKKYYCHRLDENKSQLVFKKV